MGRSAYCFEHTIGPDWYKEGCSNLAKKDAVVDVVVWLAIGGLFVKERLFDWLFVADKDDDDDDDDTANDVFGAVDDDVSIRIGSRGSVKLKNDDNSCGNVQHHSNINEKNGDDCKILGFCKKCDIIS